MGLRGCFKYPMPHFPQIHKVVHTGKSMFSRGISGKLNQTPTEAHLIGKFLIKPGQNHFSIAAA